MTDRPTRTLDRLLADVTVGQPPVQQLLSAARSARRRRRRRVLAGVAAATALTVGAATAGAVTWPPDPPQEPATTGSAVRLSATMDPEGPEIFYFEGALVEVSLLAEGDGSRVAHLGPGTAPLRESVGDLEPGRYVVQAAVRPCGGNCNVLDSPTDTCQHPVDVAADTTIEVVFRYGQACTVAVDGVAVEPEVRSSTVMLEQSRLCLGRGTVTALDVPGPGQRTPSRAVRPYVTGAGLFAHWTGRHATVSVLQADGDVAQVFRVTPRDDGWWPDAYVTC